MSEVILKVENLSKQYRLGTVGTGTLSHDLNRWWASVRGKEDPYLKVGDVNDRSTKGNSDYIWALRDINFEVQQGEVLGIIGKNGAGKSTLLKILSKITAPTTGSIKSNGRIASLLEVGTGFHGEMTGRENIYLNGAILGMTKAEITAKLDEIIAFSGVERYIDTPVKRYSSGMTVRLAFAVAAFLEPDILVIDEVLAVGDAEFQKKAIGKMQEISRGEGRTVLFVSHNMAAVKSLCTRGIVLENGEIKFGGNIDECVEKYHNRIPNYDSSFQRNNSKILNEIAIEQIEIKDNLDKLKNTFLFNEKILIDFKFISKYNINENSRYKLFCTVVNQNRDRVCSFESELIKTNRIKLKIDAEFLVRGRYFINAFIHIPRLMRIDEVDEVCLFEVIDEKSSLSIHGAYDYGQVFGKGIWEI
ncbi:MAG: ABC transporter ATP-binding protein [Flavobacteriaceae bacterium]|nr:ABC transporter ATP-binding protein [Flavobacteriaceae bacterium]